PIVYEVDRIHDGRSFTTRRVVAVQHGQAIFNLAASFQLDQAGLDHQGEMPVAPPPESLPTLAEASAQAGGVLDEAWSRPRPIDIRHTDVPPPLLPSGQRLSRPMVWLRADGRL